MKVLFAVLALAFAVSTLAQTPIKKQQVTTLAALSTTHQAVLTWVNPTTCTDGSPCTPVAITVYKVVGTCSAPTNQFTKLATVSGTTRTYTDAGLAPATTYCYYVTASLANPPAWDAAVTYTGGQMVTYNGGVYVALNTANANLNQVPTNTLFWSPGTVESAASAAVGGSTGTTGPPAPPSSVTITVQ